MAHPKPCMYCGEQTRRDDGICAACSTDVLLVSQGTTWTSPSAA
jgi:hypothetical protein